MAETNSNEICDVLVIGGGVIGCAALRELTKHGYKCLLVEKENDLISGASSGNSGIATTGFDADPGTLEGKFLKESQVLTLDLESLNVPVKRIGAIVVAWTNDELTKLTELEAKAHHMGVYNTRQLSQKELFELEPNLSRAALAGLLIPGEAPLDSWLFPVILAHTAIRNGSQVTVGCEVLSGYQLKDGSWLLKTSHGNVRAKAVVNAAGLYGDVIEGICRPPNFSIHPRKGQFVIYGREASKLVHHVIMPIPSERTKGTFVFPSVHGHLVVGPTADETNERSQPTTDAKVTSSLIKYGQSIIPRLVEHNSIAVYAGLRPATETQDYHLCADRQKQWITVAGIRSTGVSACLAIARQVRHLIEDENQLHLRPSMTSRIQSPGAVTWWPTADGHSVVMDGVAYRVTHPLSRLGLASTRCSKL